MPPAIDTGLDLGTPTPRYDSRLQKAGAILPEMRALVRLWREDATLDEMKQRLLETNVLGKGSRARMLDVMKRTFIPRYVKGSPPNAWRALRPFEEARAPLAVVRPLYYLHAARSEALLGDFVRDEIYPRYQVGMHDVTVGHVLTFLRAAEADGRLAEPWTEAVSTKVARGVLAALRDFGVLEGKIHKHIALPALPIVSFAYVAFVLSQEERSGGRLLDHPDWRLFLLAPELVERSFLEAHQQRLLSYQAAGSIVRLEFPASNLEAYAHVLAERAH